MPYMKGYPSTSIIVKYITWSCCNDVITVPHKLLLLLVLRAGVDFRVKYLDVEGKRIKLAVW
jgi:hypothetical protein